MNKTRTKRKTSTIHLTENTRISHLFAFMVKFRIYSHLFRKYENYVPLLITKGAFNNFKQFLFFFNGFFNNFSIDSP